MYCTCIHARIYDILFYVACPPGWAVYNKKCFKWIESGKVMRLNAPDTCANLIPGSPIYIAKPESYDEEMFILSLISWDGYVELFNMSLLVIRKIGVFKSER